MAANLTIYLLEQLTDYSDFERMCHDLMALEGFPKIEPLFTSGKIYVRGKFNSLIWIYSEFSASLCFHFELSAKICFIFILDAKI